MGPGTLKIGPQQAKPLRPDFPFNMADGIIPFQSNDHAVNWELYLVTIQITYSYATGYITTPPCTTLVLLNIGGVSTAVNETYPAKGFCVSNSIFITNGTSNTISKIYKGAAGCSIDEDILTLNKLSSTQLYYKSTLYTNFYNFFFAFALYR